MILLFCSIYRKIWPDLPAVMMSVAGHFTSILISADFRPEAFALRVRRPERSLDWTIAVSMPLKACICGFWNDSRQVASPLATARNEPAPLTLNRTVLLSVGQRLPSLSVTFTVT